MDGSYENEGAGMSDKEYFAVDAMSASMLKAGAVSMLYMQHRMETPIG